MKISENLSRGHVLDKTKLICIILSQIYNLSNNMAKFTKFSITNQRESLIKLKKTSAIFCVHIDIDSL